MHGHDDNTLESIEVGIDQAVSDTHHTQTLYSGIRTTLDRAEPINTSILAIPLMFEIGCNPVSLSDTQVNADDVVLLY